MKPGDTVYVINGRRIEAVVCDWCRQNYIMVLRREVGFPSLQNRTVNPTDVFASPEAARAELGRRHEERIAALTRQLERERAFDPDAAPVHDMTTPPKGGSR